MIKSGLQRVFWQSEIVAEGERVYICLWVNAQCPSILTFNQFPVMYESTLANRASSNQVSRETVLMELLNMNPIM